MQIPQIKGLAELTSKYNIFIFDIWGVIHAGGDIFPAAIDCIQKLKAAGKRVVFLSNAPRRSIKVMHILQQKGLCPELYEFILSSGQAARNAFEKRDYAILNTIGLNYYKIGDEEDDDILDSLPLKRSNTILMSDFLLGIGLSAKKPNISDYNDTLNDALSRNIPMVCVNPDKEVVRLGKYEPCAGALASYYSEKRGHVIYIGKPYPYIYKLCLAMLGTEDKSKILAVGDSLETDIRGADRVGIDSLLVTSGVLAQKLEIMHPQATVSKTLSNLCKQEKVVPTAAISELCW